MRKIVLLLCLLAAAPAFAQLTDSTFYGNIKAGMLRSDYERPGVGDPVVIMNNVYTLVPRFYKGQELVSLNIESAPETLKNFSIIENKLLSLYEVISTKYGRPNNLKLVSDPTAIPVDGSQMVTMWSIDKKLITLSARRDGDSYVAVYKVFIDGYEEKLEERDEDRAAKARKDAGAKF